MKKFKEFKINLKNIVIFGYSEFFFEILKVNELKNLNTLFVTKPDTVKSKNLKNHIITTNKIDNKFLLKLKKKIDFKKTLFISLGSRWIFDKDLIKIFNNQLINFHSSLLPFDKGGGGYTWRILRNDRVYSSTVHLVDEKIDNGMILDQVIDLFPDSARIPKDFIKFGLKKFLDQYKRFLSEVISGKQFLLISNNNNIGDYYPRLSTKINGWIDWSWKPENLERFINAFDEPYEGAKTYLYNEEVYISDVRLSSSFKSNHSFVSGIVTHKFKDFLVVHCGENSCLLIKSIKNKKKKNIFYKIKLGDRLWTSQKKLDLSKRRVFYN